MAVQDDRRNWHLDKSISISHLLTTVTLAVAGTFYIAGMQTQIDLGRAQARHTQEQITAMQRILGEGSGPVRRDIDRIQNDLNKVNEKLDMLILGQVKPRYLKDYK